MESLNASILDVVLKIREGNGFGFLTSPFVIVCHLNGRVLTSDPIACSSNPTLEADFVWESEKKFLRSMRSNNYSIRIECFSDAKFKNHDKIGYVLLNMKQQAQIVSSKLGSNLTYHWHRLLGVRSQAKSYKPEILLTLFIKEADFEIGSKTPRTPPGGALVDGKPEIADKEMPQDAVVPSEKYIPKTIVQCGPPIESDLTFKLQVKIISVSNLSAALPDNGATGQDLRFEFALFGECYKTGDLSSAQGDVAGECITIQVKSQLNSIAAYFSQFPNLDFLLQASGQTISKAPFNMHDFISLDKCDQLVDGKVSTLKQESKLNFENGEGREANSYVIVNISLEHEKGKVKNPVKPFTISHSNVKEKRDAQAAGEKFKSKGVYYKAKTVVTEVDNKIEEMESVSEPPPPQRIVPESEPIQNNHQYNFNKPVIENIEEKPIHQYNVDSGQFQNNQNSMRNLMNINNFDPSPQNLKQFVYPYFQQTHPFPPPHFQQAARMETCDVLPQQISFTDSVKAKITEELAKKTIDELEDWKEKQKENYKTDLKKKLDREVKKLTSEWLYRQDELERTATSNIEESVSLSQQLHSTSAELKVRLEAVNRLQMELEKEKEQLDRKYSDKHLELREASKKHQASLQLEITSLKSEVEELRAKLCSLMKENEMLKSSPRVGFDEGQGDAGSSRSQAVKTTDLTEQQVTSLLVDMKSLEEKLSAALESKEFFRKEWSKALREIHRIKTEQEEQVRLQLQSQRQELDNLKLVGIIAADDKASKDDLSSIRDLRNQIVRLNHPKSS